MGDFEEGHNYELQCTGITSDDFGPDLKAECIPILKQNVKGIFLLPRTFLSLVVPEPVQENRVAFNDGDGKVEGIFSFSAGASKPVEKISEPEEPQPATHLATPRPLLKPIASDISDVSL